MSNVRFLDQVSVSSFDTSGGSGTGDTGSLLITASEALNGITFTKGDNSTFTVNVEGAAGPTGPSGPSGSAGVDGNLAQWKYDSNTDPNTGPSNGYIKLDADWSSTPNYLLVDDLSSTPEINFSSILNTISIGSVIKLTSITDSDVYKFLEVNSVAPLESGYEKYTVTQIGSNGTLSNNDLIAFSLPAPATSPVSVAENGTSIVSSTSTINFSGSGFAVTDAGGGVVDIENTFNVDTGSLLVTGSVTDNVLTFEKGDGSTFDLEIATDIAVSASYAATASIRYDSASGDNFSLSNIQVNDYDDNVAVTFVGGKLTFTFGTPESPTSINASLSGFATNRFNKVEDAYSVNATWNNGGYNLISASLYEGSTLLQEVGSGTSLTYSTTTSGSRTYLLEYTASSPLDGSLFKTTDSVTGTLSKSNPGNPSISSTPTVQLGYSSNQIEQGATGSIAFSATYGSANGWDEVSLSTNPSTSPISVTDSNTGSLSISITATSNYQSPAGENDPQLTTSRNSTTTYSKIRSVRYGASAASSFTQAELETLSDWDTGLGGSIGTIDKGNTNPSGDSITITWSGDKYHYIVFDSNRSNLTSITTSGFEVISQFSVTTVGDYKVYKTDTLQAGGSSTNITYTLT
jgi:hypothetical protein